MSYIGTNAQDPNYFANEPTSIELEGGTYNTDRLYRSSTATVTGDITLTNNLVLARITDKGNNVTLTSDGTTRTITGSGKIESGNIVTTMPGIFDGMTGTIGSGVTIGSAVTGSPALNMVNFTNQACFAVYNSGSNQALGTASTWLTWTSNQSDVDNLNGRNNDYYEIKEAGYYFVHGQITFGGSMYDSQYNAVALFINSTEATSAFIGGEFSQTDVATATVSFIRNLSIGDKIYLKAQHSGNTATTILNGTDRQTQLIGLKLFI